MLNAKKYITLNKFWHIKKKYPNKTMNHKNKKATKEKVLITINNYKLNYYAKVNLKEKIVSFINIA